MKAPFKFAAVSGSSFKGRLTRCSYNIFDWISVWDGVHYPIDEIRANKQELNQYDIVLFLDADRYLDDALVIARQCTCKTIFYAEGTINTYVSLPFDAQRAFYELLGAVDLVGALEENRMQWYEALWDTKTFFMHTPIPQDVIDGKYRNQHKEDQILICCNLGMDEIRYPTNLISSLGVMRNTKRPCVLCEVPPNQVWFFVEKMGVELLSYTTRIDFERYLSKLVAPSRVMLSPSTIIGTSRNAIMGAGCGTPVIGNRDSHTQMKLWPKLGVNIYDIKTMKNLVDRLYEDEKFYKEVCDYAFEQLPHYSLENAKKRFMEAIETL